MSFNITVVSKSENFDWTEFATGLVRIGEIDATSVRDMVNKVKQKAAYEKKLLDRLDIFAHGTVTYIKIGSDILHSYTPNVHKSVLKQLNGSFARDGIIVLNVCDIGRAQELITAIAQAVGVNVYACKGAVSPNLDMMWGTIVVGRPDGSFQENVKIPVDPWDGIQS